MLLLLLMLLCFSTAAHSKVIKQATVSKGTSEMDSPMAATISTSIIKSDGHKNTSYSNHLLGSNRYIGSAFSLYNSTSKNIIPKYNREPNTLGPVFRQDFRQGRDFDGMLTYLSRLLSPIDRSDYVQPIASQLEKVENEKEVRVMIDLREQAATALFLVKERFVRLQKEIPLDTDIAAEAIKADIAKTNMLGYTLGATFLAGAALDILADLYIEERNLWTLHQELDFWLLAGFLWSYALGYGGPWWFGIENPHRDCGSQQLLNLVEKFNFNLDNLVLLNSVQLELVAKAFRTEQSGALHCILSLSNSYAEADGVDKRLTELTSLPSLYKNLLALATAEEPVYPTVVSVEEADRLSQQIRDCDLQLDQIWKNLELQVSLAYDYAYAARKSENKINGLVGSFNLLGTIFGSLLITEVKAATGLPALADIPVVFTEVINDAIQGQFRNDFLKGEGFGIMGMWGWGFGYFMPYFYALVSPDPGCGINDYHDVVRNYQEFGSFTVTFGSPEGIMQGSVLPTPKTFPLYAKYRVEQFVEDLRLALHCLVNRDEKTSISLSRNIDMWLEIALLRLDLTSALMGI